MFEQNAVRRRTWFFWFALVAACMTDERAEPKREEERGPVVVYAASSLRDALLEVAPLLQADEQIDLTFNFGGSNALAQQISAAPRADIFLSAHAEWVSFLRDKKLVARDSERVFLANKLVVIGHVSGERAPRDLGSLSGSSFSFLAMGDPNAVPAGKYARAALSRVRVGEHDLWSEIASRVVPASDVRAALALVESDPRALGIVYQSDVIASTKARALFELPEPSPEEAVRYHAAVISKSERPKLARRVVAVLLGERAQQIFQKFGFMPLSKMRTESASATDQGR